MSVSYNIGVFLEPRNKMYENYNNTLTKLLRYITIKVKYVV